MKIFGTLAISAACFTFVLSTSVPAKSEVQTFGRSATLIKYSNAKLQSGQRSLLRWLKSKSHMQYFGAMYFNPTEDNGFAVTQYHSLENAKVAAKAGCQITSKSNPDQCKLYATVVPKSFSANVAKASGLGQMAYSIFIG